MSEEKELIINTLNEKGYDPIFEEEFYKLRTLKLKVDETSVDEPEYAELQKSFLDLEREFEDKFLRLKSC